jgi:hypothetical protein
MAAQAIGEGFDSAAVARKLERPSKDPENLVEAPPAELG